jgi:F-type H+-transporting ATPase subunit delta
VSVVHRVYAGALYDAAREAGRVDAVGKELGGFAAQVRDVRELRAVLRNPQLDPRAKASVLDALTESGDDLVRNFLRLLAEKNRIAEIEEIAREFERLVAREQGQLTVELTTAYELSEDAARSIVDQIAEVSGRRVEATRKVDPDLIGGIVLQAGSFRVDASVRGRLNRLRHELATRS